MDKKIQSVVKLQIAAGKASPAPPVGPALAQYGINMSEFCQRFNDATANQSGWTIPVEITIYEDKSYAFKLNEPPVSELIKKTLGIEKGSGEPNKKKIGSLTSSQVEEIAQRKMNDLNANDLEAAKKTVEGTARSMGITIE